MSRPLVVLLFFALCLAELDSFLGAPARFSNGGSGGGGGGGGARSVWAASRRDRVDSASCLCDVRASPDSLHTLPNQNELGLFNHLVLDDNARQPRPAARVPDAVYRYDFARDYKAALCVRARARVLRVDERRALTRRARARVRGTHTRAHARRARRQPCAAHAPTPSRF